MPVNDLDYIYDDMDLGMDLIDYHGNIIPEYFSPWDKFDVDEINFSYVGSDHQESPCLAQDLMWSSVAEDVEDGTKVMKRSPERFSYQMPAKSCTPPVAMVPSTPPNQRSLLIKSQPQYQAASSIPYSPPISDNEDEGLTDTLKTLQDHIKDCGFHVLHEPIKDIGIHMLLPSCDSDFFDENDAIKMITPPLSLSPRSQSPLPRPSFEMDHCYSKEAEPDDDNGYECNLGIDTPSETEDEEESEKADESFEVEEENEQYKEEDEEDEEEEEEDESVMRMANDDDDDEEEEIDVVSVSDHTVDIRGSTSSYLYPKANLTRNVYGSYGTIPKKTLPIPERKCVNGKYILMDMEVPTPVKRNAGRIATKPLPKKRRLSSSEEDDDDDDSDSESSYKRSYSKYGSRKQRSPPKKRRTSVELESGSDKRNLHNSLERMRRIGLKNLFDNLRNSIPTISQRERTAKVVILNTATSMVGQVQRQEEKYAAEKVALKRKQEALRKRLSELRKSAARFR